MTWTKNSVKGIIYAIVVIALVISLYFNFRPSTGKSFLDEYRANSKRIEEQQLRYDETQRRILDFVENLDGGVDSLIGRVEAIEGGINEIKGYNRQLTDKSVESAILGDRNDRLLKELEQRIIEGTENE